MLPLFIQSIFIPYSATKETTIPILMTVDEIDSNALSHDNVAYLALDKQMSEGRRNTIEKAFSGASLLYGDRCFFAIIDESISADYGVNSSTKCPFYAFYRGGEPLASYTYPEHDDSFLTSLSLFLDPLYPEITEYFEVLKNLRHCPFTIISPKNLTQKALELQFDASSQTGPINVITANEATMQALGVSPTHLAFYRQEDSGVETMKTNKLETIYDLTYPVFRYFLRSDIESGLVFALIGDAFQQPQKQFLYNLGSRFPSITIGYAPSALESDISDITGEYYDGSTTIAFFDADKQVYYNTSNYFTKALMTMGFDANRWEGAAVRLIQDVLQLKLNSSFVSEEDKKSLDAKESEMLGPIVKLIGTTYEDFINDPNNDVIVLYKRENCPNCVQAFPVFKNFAEEMVKLGLNITCGIIDVGRNKAPKGFPYMAGVPHFQIWPAKNKSNTNSLRGERTRLQLLRLVDKYGSIKLPFEVPQPEKTEMAALLFQLLSMGDQLPAAEKMKTLDYIKEVSEAMGVNLDGAKKPENETTKSAPKVDWDKIKKEAMNAAL